LILKFFHISLDANPLMVAYGPWNLEKRKKIWAHTSRPKLGVLTRIFFLSGIEGMHRTEQADYFKKSAKNEAKFNSVR
jgi:hypothetical protein